MKLTEASHGNPPLGLRFSEGLASTFGDPQMQRQTTPYSLTQYLDAGCQTLTRDGKLDLIGAGIHAVTGGMACNGCHMLKTGCKSFDKLRGDAVARPKAAHPGATVREEAARRGISIGEVRRQRQASLVSG